MLEIGKVAEITGLTSHTLRAWEKRYDILPAKRTSTGRRLYDHETVEHLKLLKLCIDLGYSIGNMAHLPTADLKKLIDEANENMSFGAAQRTQPGSQLVIALVNLASGREPLLDSVTPYYENIQVVHFDCFSELITYMQTPCSDTDYLVCAYCKNLNEASFAACSQLCAQNIPLMVSYNFGRMNVRKNYEKLGIYLQKAPIQGDWLRPLVSQIQSRWTHHDMEHNLPEPKLLDKHAKNVAQKFFSEQSLDWINQNITRLKCECPNHISELIIKLNAFEAYSQTCLIESPEDFDLHQEIYVTTTQVRHTLEEMLKKVLENEGVDVSALSREPVPG